MHYLILSLLFAPSVMIYERQEEPVKSHFEVIKGYPIEAQRIIYCESKNDHYAEGENFIDGEVWSRDHSFWQINDYYHTTKASDMGLDIKDPSDNLTYGYWLYQAEGSKHWLASKECWTNPELKIN